MSQDVTDIFLRGTNGESVEELVESFLFLTGMKGESEEELVEIFLRRVNVPGLEEEAFSVGLKALTLVPIDTTDFFLRLMNLGVENALLVPLEIFRSLARVSPVNDTKI